MRRWMRRAAILTALVGVMLLGGCTTQEEAEPLPVSMDAQTVLSAGEDVLDQLLAGEYEAVYDAFREDVRASLTVEDVRGLVEPVFAEAGEFEGIETSEAVGGSTEGGENHGIARFLCTFSEEKAAVNVAFDTEMQLIGLAAGLQTSSWSFSNLVENVTGLFGG